ncbi:MAG: PHP domain-containing protein [Actinomycetota bacterium]
MALTNAAIAELLALEAEKHTGNKERAARRGARAALMWPDELAETLARGGTLEDLRAVGPWISGLIESWIADPPELVAPPDIRRDFRSFASARARLAAAPAEKSELRGDLQMHSLYSDGTCTIAEMAEHCIGLGYSYLAITDHSQGLKIAGGMDEDALARQADEVRALNEELEGRFEVLHSLEMNLSPAGEGDMEPSALAGLDLVLGSFHSQLRTKDDQTDRYLAALANPDIQVLGHPRGRQWNFRLGLTADWPRVFAAAHAADKAVEIDAHPNRQDLNVELLQIARDAGTRISIGTDAHYPFELLFIDLGLAAALEAGIPRDRILNLMPADELKRWAGDVRARARVAGA